MLRRALAVLVSAAFLAAAAPLAPAPAARSHACCEDSPKKAPAGDAHACCRPALPASNSVDAAAPAVVAILGHEAPAVADANGALPSASFAASAPLDGTPPSWSGLSPPRA